MRDSKPPHVQGQGWPKSALSPWLSDHSHGVTESCKRSCGGEVGSGSGVLPERQMALYSVETALTLSGLWLGE